MSFNIYSVLSSDQVFFFFFFLKELKENTWFSDEQIGVSCAIQDFLICHG